MKEFFLANPMLFETEIRRGEKIILKRLIVKRIIVHVKLFILVVI